MPTRINDPAKSAIITIMQRVHEHDVSGLIISKELGFTHLCIPMEFEPERKCFTEVKGVPFFEDPRIVDGELAWPQRYTREFLEGTLKPMMMSQGGDFSVASQLQQRPQPRGGLMFKKPWFEDKIVSGIPEPVSKRVRAWDLAGSKTKRSPRSASVRLARGKSGAIYVEHCHAFRGSPLEVEQRVRALSQADRDAGLSVQVVLPQDPAQAGKSQKIQYARGPLAGFDFKFVRESAEGDKASRARPFAAQCELGNVFVVKGDWNDDFLNELFTFPTGRYKDRVDATSLAYLSLVDQPVQSAPAPGELILPQADPEDAGY